MPTVTANGSVCLPITAQVLEETGIIVENAAFVTAENTVFPDGKHYVTIFVLATAPEVRTNPAGASCQM